MESTKSLKKCSFCGKEIRNLPEHIIRNHPKMLEKLDEYDANIPQFTTQSPVFEPQKPQIVRYGGSINDMIREKLDTMLNIKIIEMLSKNPDVSLQQIAQAIQPPPPQPTALDKMKELREYAGLVADIKGAGEPIVESGGNEWVGLATAALPLVKDMLQSRKNNEVKQNVIREGNPGSQRTLKRIQPETSGSPGKSIPTERKPGSDSGAEQQIS